MKLSKLALSASLGVIWGLFILMLGAWEMIFDYSNPQLAFLQAIYVGYSARPLGDIIGFIWGAFDGAIFGFLVAGFYNTAIHIFRIQPEK